MVPACYLENVSLDKKPDEPNLLIHVCCEAGQYFYTQLWFNFKLVVYGLIFWVGRLRLYIRLYHHVRLNPKL